MNQKAKNKKEKIEEYLYKTDVDFESNVVKDPDTKGYFIGINSENASGIFSESYQNNFKFFIINSKLIEFVKQDPTYEDLSEQDQEDIINGLPKFIPVEETDFLRYLTGEKILEPIEQI